MQFEPLLRASEGQQTNSHVHFDADIDNSDDEEAELPDR